MTRRHITNVPLTSFAKSLQLGKAFLVAMARSTDDTYEAYITPSILDLHAPFSLAEICGKLLDMTDVTRETCYFWRASFADDLILHRARKMNFFGTKDFRTPPASFILDFIGSFMGIARTSGHTKMASTCAPWRDAICVY